MRNKELTKNYYVHQLGFKNVGQADYDGYLMLQKDDIEIHFFQFKNLQPENNYGQVYIRTTQIDVFYKSLLTQKVAIHPNAALETKPWGQREFALLDPDNNLLTFGEAVAE